MHNEAPAAQRAAELLEATRGQLRIYDGDAAARLDWYDLGERAQTLSERRLEAGHSRWHARRPQRRQRRQRGRDADAVAVVGAAKAHLFFTASAQLNGHSPRQEDRRQRYQSRCEGLSGDGYIGTQAEVLLREQRAGSVHPAGHLVSDNQHPLSGLAPQVLQPMRERGRGAERAIGDLHRLEDKRRRHPLRDELMTQHPFPLATYHLKWFRIREGTTIELLAKSPLLTKRRQIAPLLKTYPHRRFALVGDSGERDPEVYTNLLTDKLLTPERLAGIFIRDVTCDAQGVHTRPVATGLAGTLEGAGREVGRTVKDHLPTSSTRSCRQRRFAQVFKAFAAATRAPAGAAAEPRWRKWCVFYGGEDAAAQAAVPALATPVLDELSDEDRPAQCWPHSAAEFAAALSD